MMYCVNCPAVFIDTFLHPCIHCIAGPHFLIIAQLWAFKISEKKSATFWNSNKQYYWLKVTICFGFLLSSLLDGFPFSPRGSMLWLSGTLIFNRHAIYRGERSQTEIFNWIRWFWVPVGDTLKGPISDNAENQADFKASQFGQPKSLRHLCKFCNAPSSSEQRSYCVLVPIISKE